MNHDGQTVYALHNTDVVYYSRYMSSYFGGSSDCLTVEKFKIPLSESKVISQFESLFVDSDELVCSFGPLGVCTYLAFDNEFIVLPALNIVVSSVLE